MTTFLSRVEPEAAPELGLPEHHALAATIFLGVPETTRDAGCAAQPGRVVRDGRPLRRPAVRAVAPRSGRESSPDTWDGSRPDRPVVTIPAQIGGRQRIARNAARTSSTNESRAARRRRSGRRRSSSFQWRMSVKRRSAQRRDGRKISLGKIDMPGRHVDASPRRPAEALPVQPAPTRRRPRAASSASRCRAAARGAARPRGGRRGRPTTRTSRGSTPPARPASRRGRSRASAGGSTAASSTRCPTRW